MNDQQADRMIRLLETIEGNVKRSKSRANYYSQTVHVTTIFFSTFMAIGLQKIFDQPLDGHNWVCFFVAFTLFFRFLSGSANHLWFEHVVAVPTRKSRHGLLRHSGWLAFFAFFGLRICFAKSVNDFLIWSGLFGGLTVVAPIIDTWLDPTGEPTQSARARELFYEWLVLNAIFLALVGCTWFGCTIGLGKGKPDSMSLPLLFLAGGCLVLLGADLRIQLKYLEVKHKG